MRVTKERVAHARQLHTQFVVSAIARQREIGLAEAYRHFAQTKTYDLLMSEKSKLYTNSFEYVLDMYNSEIAGDWESWIEV